MAALNKNNSATLIGLALAILTAFVMIDFTDFQWKRDWAKLIIPLAIAVKGWLVSFNEKSLNSKAKKGF